MCCGSLVRTVQRPLSAGPTTSAGRREPGFARADRTLDLELGHPDVSELDQVAATVVLQSDEALGELP